MIGSTIIGLTDLRLLSTPVRYPKGEFQPFSKFLDLGDGQKKGGGWPLATWHWELLNASERTMLRTFCTSASATVYIVTRVNEADAFLAYQAIMQWPEKEPRDFLRRLNFDIEFRALVAQ
jgi:hypothetical protein